MDSTTDNTLMMNVKEGDLDKLGVLFERYNQKLYHFFYRLTRRQDISEDLVQSVFERILKYRKSYSSKGSFSTWMFQIARNLHSDYYRNVQKREVLSGTINWDELEGRGNGHEPGEGGDHQDEELKWLQQALDQLDEVKKQTLVLSRFQGFRYHEIAGIMRCSESAVKVRIFRALGELEVQIKELKRKSSL